MNKLNLTIVISANEEKDIITGEEEINKTLMFEYSNKENPYDCIVLLIDNTGFLVLNIKKQSMFTDYILGFVSYIYGVEVTKNDLYKCYNGSYEFMSLEEDVERWNRAINFINQNKLKVNYSQELSFSSEEISSNLILKKINI